jgi:MOSC domain-containing protein YiiM
MTMSKGSVAAICIGAEAGGIMREVQEVFAVTGNGLQGDRYLDGNGSFNKGKSEKRQVTFMNAMFFPGSGFTYPDSRRNIFTNKVELMDLIGKPFSIGEVMFEGVKYCDPCTRPNRLAGIEKSFRETFFDRGGLVASVTRGGIIRVGDTVIVPKKNY